jgi:hypothetical protein
MEWVRTYWSRATIRPEPRNALRFKTLQSTLGRDLGYRWSIRHTSRVARTRVFDNGWARRNSGHGAHIATACHQTLGIGRTSGAIPHAHYGLRCILTLTEAGLERTKHGETHVMPAQLDLEKVYGSSKAMRLRRELFSLTR